MKNGVCVVTPMVFVITGESNSGGLGPNSSATTPELAPRPVVQIMNLTSGLFKFEDLLIGTNNLRDHAGLEAYYGTAHGFELELANLVEANAFPANPKVYLIKTGHGGSTVAQWNVGGVYWTKFLQRIAAAKTQVPSNTQWVVWMSLGLNDAYAGTAPDTWRVAMEAHLNKIKDLLPGVKVFLTKFDSMSGAFSSSYEAALNQMAVDLPNVYAVETTGASLLNAAHWDYAGLKIVTDRLVAKTKEALGL
jgi:hypothetical protein